jgi:hypothetical protein
MLTMMCKISRKITPSAAPVSVVNRGSLPTPDARFYGFDATMAKNFLTHDA